MNLPLFIGLRYIGARRKSRSVSFLSAVSMGGLAVGIALLILVLSVMNGFDRELKQRILGLVPQAAIYHRHHLENWQVLKREVEAMSGVMSAAPFVQLNALMSHRGNTTAVLLYGFDPNAEQSVSLINEFVDADVQARIEANESVVVLGKGVADELDISVGERLMVVVPDAKSAARTPRIAYLQVAQIIESETELDASMALSSLEQTAILNGAPGHVSGLRLKVDDLFDAPRIMYQVTTVLGPSYYSSNWTRTHWNLYQAIRMSKNLVGLLMSLIVGLAAFNVVSTLVLVVIDKQGDIAILRTLGSSSRQVMAIFIVKGLVIGLCGTAIGVFLGSLLALGAESFVGFIESLFDVQFLQSDVYPLTYLPTEIRLGDIILVALTALGMSLVATLYPAWKATKVQPAEALRYE